MVNSGANIFTLYKKDMQCINFTVIANDRMLDLEKFLDRGRRCSFVPRQMSKVNIVDYHIFKRRLNLNRVPDQKNVPWWDLRHLFHVVVDRTQLILDDDKLFTIFRINF